MNQAPSLSSALDTLLAMDTDSAFIFALTINLYCRALQHRKGKSNLLAEDVYNIVAMTRMLLVAEEPVPEPEAVKVATAIDRSRRV